KASAAASSSAFLFTVISPRQSSAKNFSNKSGKAAVHAPQGRPRNVTVKNSGAMAFLTSARFDRLHGRMKITEIENYIGRPPRRPVSRVRARVRNSGHDASNRK